MARILRDAVINSFERMNRQGGVFGRQIEVSFLNIPKAVEIGDILRGEETFAVLDLGDVESETLANERTGWERASTSAELLTEALSRAGRDLNGERFLAALESFREVRTTPPILISFGPGRRTGTDKVVTMKLDPGAGKFVRIYNYVR